MIDGKSTDPQAPDESTQRLEIVVSLDRVVGTRYDDDGDPIEDITVLDRVIEKAAADLMRSQRRDVYDLVREAVKASARAAADEAIAKAMSEPFHPTNRYGERTTGEPMTLRAMIADEAQRWMATANDRINGRDKPVFAALLQTEVDEAMRKELVTPVRKARDAAVARVKDKASELVAGAVREAMKP